jgi:hypothetical protein
LSEGPSFPLIINGLYVLDAAFASDPEFGHVFWNANILAIMGEIFQSWLQGQTILEITDLFPFLNISINLCYRDKAAQILYESTFYELSMSSFLHRFAEGYPCASESEYGLAIRIIRLIGRVFTHQEDSFTLSDDIVDSVVVNFRDRLQVNSAHLGLPGHC